MQNPAPRLWYRNPLKAQSCLSAQSQSFVRCDSHIAHPIAMPYPMPRVRLSVNHQGNTPVEWQQDKYPDAHTLRAAHCMRRDDGSV